MNVLALERVFWEPSAECQGAEGLPYLKWCVENHPGGFAQTALLSLYEPGAGAEHLLMWQNTFSIENVFADPPLCRELQDKLSPETNMPAEVPVTTFDLFHPSSRLHLFNSFHALSLSNTKKQVAGFSLKYIITSFITVLSFMPERFADVLALGQAEYWYYCPGCVKKALPQVMHRVLLL